MKKTSPHHDFGLQSTGQPSQAPTAVRSESVQSARAGWKLARVMGVEYFVGDIELATQIVVDRAMSRQGGFSCLCGVHGIVTAQHREPLMHAMADAWLNFPDGAPVAWLMRRTGHGRARRVAGPDLMPRVIDAGQRTGLRHLLFGSTPEVLNRLERRLLDRYPNADIVGAISPPFRSLSDDEEAAICAEIRALSPDIVWVGLGLPKQDEWMWRNRDRYAPSLAMGVGAAFDFLAGTKPRAPGWMQRLGLEWLHRLLHEPRRLAGRYTSTNSEFMWRAGAVLMRRRARSVTDALRRRR
jgi:N-acetylglucosaminyldiphosphoundecaprenol N-acetyl-beta-D-mannosaminyltransferase